MLVPAMLTMKSTTFSVANRKAIVPPSLCPMTPIFLNGYFFLRCSIPAWASRVKSSVVQAVGTPVERPVPRSSYRSEAIPFRAR